MPSGQIFRLSDRLRPRPALAWLTTLLLAALLACGPPRAEADQPAAHKKLNPEEECLLQALKTADPGLSVGELKNHCRLAVEKAKKQAAETGQPQAESVDERLEEDKENTLKPYTLMAYKPNYFLIGDYSFSGVNEQPLRTEFPDRDIALYRWEAKFQLSIKMPLTPTWCDGRLTFFGGYTNRSFWQLYRTISAPFRETNHEPEIWGQYRIDKKRWGVNFRLATLSLVHQSNGQGGSLSRSWNRIVARLDFERKPLALKLTSWFRIPENASDDDNPDILRYMGWGQVRLVYEKDDHTVSLMVRNLLESGFQRGAVEISYSFPLGPYKYLKGYLLYFSGYGESLIDYNHYTHTIGIGISLTDW